MRRNYCGLDSSINEKSAHVDDIDECCRDYHMSSRELNPSRNPWSSRFVYSFAPVVNGKIHSCEDGGANKRKVSSSANTPECDSESEEAKKQCKIALDLSTCIQTAAKIAWSEDEAIDNRKNYASWKGYKRPVEDRRRLSSTDANDKCLAWAQEDKDLHGDSFVKAVELNFPCPPNLDEMRSDKGLPFLNNCKKILCNFLLLPHRMC